jgi:hypothetical protein
MEKRILIMDTCVMCPYYTFVEDSYCHLYNRKIEHEIGSQYPIPEWCKLPKSTALIEMAVN